MKVWRWEGPVWLWKADQFGKSPLDWRHWAFRWRGIIVGAWFFGAIKLTEKKPLTDHPGGTDRG